jgi:hypothetical protein
VPRGVVVSAESRQEAEQQVLSECPDFMILRSRELDLSGLPELASGAIPRQWVVVVAHRDPAKEATLIQQEDPEREAERAQRLFFLQLATNPDLLINGIQESFDCPECGLRGMISLAPPRERADPEHARCPECGTHFHRRTGARTWSKPERESFPDCIFCGNPADSKEHVIPRWISKRLDVRNELLPRPGTPGLASRRRQPISFGSFRRRFFCEECNTHFKGLEDRTLPLIESMARGRHLVLGSSELELLSLWATKTAVAMTVALADDPGTVSLEARRAIRFDSRPPERSWVGVFENSGDPIVAADALTKQERTDQLGGARPFRALLAFRHFGFFVAVESGAARKDHLPVEPRGELREIWPSEPARLLWPC